MIKHLKLPLGILFLCTLILLPLAIVLSNSYIMLAYVISVFQTIVWVLIVQVVLIGKRFKMDGAALALGGVIGIKFFFSMALFLLLYKMNLIQSKIDILIFFAMYLIYTPLIYSAGNNMVKED